MTLPPVTLSPLEPKKWGRQFRRRRPSARPAARRGLPADASLGGGVVWNDDSWHGAEAFRCGANPVRAGPAGSARCGGLVGSRENDVGVDVAGDESAGEFGDAQALIAGVGAQRDERLVGADPVLLGRPSLGLFDGHAAVQRTVDPPYVSSEPTCARQTHRSIRCGTRGVTAWAFGPGSARAAAHYPRGPMSSCAPMNADAQPAEGGGAREGIEDPLPRVRISGHPWCPLLGGEASSSMRTDVCGGVTTWITIERDRTRGRQTRRASASIPTWDQVQA